MVLGLIGCGVWGANVLRDLRTLGCQVRVVARSSASAARASDGGAVAVVREIEQLGAVDGVVVVTPIATHAAVLERAIEFGVPVYVEKPLCDDPDVAARLARLAPERLFVMDKWRYHPGVREIAEIARDGRLGRVHGLRTVRVQRGNRHTDADCMWVLAPHDLAIALEVLGEVPQPTAARGHWANGRLVTLHGLLEADAGWHAVEVSERAAGAARRIELHCADGLAVLDGGWDEHVTISRPDGSAERVETPGELPLLAELRGFVGHLDGGPPPKSSAAEGYAVVRAVAGLRTLAA